MALDAANPPSHETSRGDPDDTIPSSKRRRVDSSRNDSIDLSRKSASRRKAACQSCRIRKVKCDAVRPVCGICSACETTCQYTEPFSDKLTLESATELVCSRLDRLQSDIDNIRQHWQNQVTHDRGSGQDQEHSDGADHLGQTTTSYIAEPSKDFLQIPAHKTTADTVLTWEIFEGKWPLMSLVGGLFVSDPGQDRGSGSESISVPGGLIPPSEEQMPLLVDKFLQNVHTKNPVLDVEQLVKHARNIASQGLGWDAWSCLVLLASALGAIAKPFGASITLSSSPSVGRAAPQATSARDGTTSQRELQQAESYFVLACRRLGSLQYSILGSQCYFFAGVYLMYTMRPLLSWQYFAQSSQLYQLHMKSTHGLATDVSQLGELSIQHAPASDIKRRRLEESMYWSCFKSECEFRVELPLPQSEIASYSHPQMFPSPPLPAGIEDTGDLERTMSNYSTFETVQSTTSNGEDSELRQHAKQLCNEEESWYYYLTEIALRRIGNRIINTFFSQGHAAWLDIKPLLGIALEFDTQVSAWSANLPTAMQHWEMNDTIRAPTLASYLDGTRSSVTRELSWATDNRLLEMRSWLYQPFLYYFIHCQSPIDFASHLPNQDDFVSSVVETPGGLTPEHAAALFHCITSGIECALKVLDVRALRHRHHGLWYDMRSLMTASLILLAIVKSGHEAWIPCGADHLWGHNFSVKQPIGGKIGQVMAEFLFWSAESSVLSHHRDVLDEVTRTVHRVCARSQVD